MSDEKKYKCPLVNRDMWDSECYDIQMVRNGFIKPVVLEFIFNKMEADKLCANCFFNQLALVSSTNQMVGEGCESANIE